MPEFNLADLIADSVSELDTVHEWIEYIPYEKIHEDPNNFYSMDGLQELASNIALCGLMDPIRVRSVDDGYIIVSGHRRFAAMGLLVADGDKRFALIPCIVEKSNVSPAMQELRLIYANSDTRKLSSADLGKQVERITDLLYQLQEEGWVFPGRMRDHVAEACNLSKTKIARLNAIRNGLCAEAMILYEKNEINESVAYTLAAAPGFHQKTIVEAFQATNTTYYEDRVKRFIAFLNLASKLSCKAGGGHCTHLAGKTKKRADDAYRYNTCEQKCCSRCDQLGSCKYACPMLVEERAAAKAILKEQRSEKIRQGKEEKRALEEKTNSDISRMTDMYENVRRLAKERRISSDAISQLLPYEFRKRTFKDRIDGKCNDVRQSDTPLELGIGLKELDAAIGMADILQCSLDELFMRTPQSQPPAPLGAWQSGAPTKLGMYAAQVVIDDNVTLLRILHLLPYRTEFSLTANHFTPIEAKRVLWIKLPDAQEDDPDEQSR